MDDRARTTKAEYLSSQGISTQQRHTPRPQRIRTYTHSMRKTGLAGHGGYDVVLRLDGGYLDQWEAYDEADDTMAGFKRLLPGMKILARYSRREVISARNPGLQR